MLLGCQESCACRGTIHHVEHTAGKLVIVPRIKILKPARSRIQMNISALQFLKPDHDGGRDPRSHSVIKLPMLNV